MDVQSPPWFVVLVAALGLAMIAAMIRRRETLYAALWLASVAALVVKGEVLLLILFLLGWLSLHALVFRTVFGKKIDDRILMMAGCVVALLIIGAGESIPALHRLDAALRPYRPMLKAALIACVAIGFALFMGGILHLIFKGGRNAITFAELKDHWRSGAWRDAPDVKRFFVVGGGVLLAITAGIALAVVFAIPGIKLLALLAWSYVVIRMGWGWHAANASIATAPRHPSGAAPRARS